MFFIKVDKNGYYQDLILSDRLPDNTGGDVYIPGTIPSHLHYSTERLPKWDGTQWIETGQAPEPVPQEPTELELLMLAISELDMQRELDRTENQVAIAELAESLIGGI